MRAVMRRASVLVTAAAGMAVLALLVAACGASTAAQHENKSGAPVVHDDTWPPAAQMQQWPLGLVSNKTVSQILGVTVKPIAAHELSWRFSWFAGPNQDTFAQVALFMNARALNSSGIWPTKKVSASGPEVLGAVASSTVAVAQLKRGAFLVVAVPKMGVKVRHGALMALFKLVTARFQFRPGLTAYAVGGARPFGAQRVAGSTTPASSGGGNGLKVMSCIIGTLADRGPYSGGFIHGGLTTSPSGPGYIVYQNGQEVSDLGWSAELNVVNTSGHTITIHTMTFVINVGGQISKPELLSGASGPGGTSPLPLTLKPGTAGSVELDQLGVGLAPGIDQNSTCSMGPWS